MSHAFQVRGEHPPLEYLNEVARGTIPGHSIWSAFGENPDLDIQTNGEDIWRGPSILVPEPDSAGEQLSVISASADDSFPSGDGVRTVRAELIRVGGIAANIDFEMNGLSAVNSTETDIIFVNRLYALTVGDNKHASGNISIFKTGGVQADTTYSFIATGGNMSLVPNRMVPAGHDLIVHGWTAHEAKNQRVSFRIRATCEDGILVPGVFLFKGPAYVAQMSPPWTPLYFKAPPGTIVKVTGWADQNNSECSCHWMGVLIEHGAL